MVKRHSELQHVFYSFTLCAWRETVKDFTNGFIVKSRVMAKNASLCINDTPSYTQNLLDIIIL